MTPTSSASGRKTRTRRSREIDVEVAELRQPVAGEAANDRDAGRHAGGGGHELQEA